MPGGRFGVGCAVPGRGRGGCLGRGHPQHPHPVDQESEKRERCSDLRREGEHVQHPLAELVGRRCQEVGREVGGEPPHPAPRLIAQRGRLGQPDQGPRTIARLKPFLNAARVSCGDHPPARQAGHPGGRDPPLPASQHQPEEPRSDDGDEHDRNDPMLAGQLFCRVGCEQLERDTADHNHEVGRGVGTDPAGQQTRVSPLARPVRGVFRGVVHGADALFFTGPRALRFGRIGRPSRSRGSPARSVRRSARRSR
jgi:hypothetical protein